MQVHDLRRKRSPVAPVERSAPVRRRLVVGANDDVAERQADEIAARVVAGFGAGSFAGPADTHRVRRSTARPTAPIGPEGGELDAATSDRIDAARAGGAPIPTRIRRGFESAMGADLAHVRVHSGRAADELNADLGATAFTSGSDVFFGGGLPDVTTSSGQHLMAHELAHVVQQQPDIGRIRRAVGFEFEIGNWTVERIDRFLWPTETSGKTPIKTADVQPYAGKIATAGPWLFTGDQSDDGTTHIEWVMEKPVEETDAGRVELAKRMDHLKAENDDLIAKRDKAKIVRKHEDKGKMLTKRYRGPAVGLSKKVLIEPYDEIRAEPQLTAGIKLDRIYRIMENLGKTKRNNETVAHHQDRQAGNAVLMRKAAGGEVDMIAGGPAAVANAFGNIAHPGPGAPTGPSTALVGVVALMRSYLIGATKKKSYAKGIAPFLAKTDFAKQFSMLPEAAYYKAHPDVWLELVLASAGLTLADAGTPLFEADVTYIVQRGLMGQLRQLTKRFWIKAIVEHDVDILTEEGMKRTALKGVADQLFGFGSLGDKTDTVGDTGDETDESAVLEFRRLTGKLPHDRWKDFALELFDYVREVNAGYYGTYGGKAFYA